MARVVVVEAGAQRRPGGGWGSLLVQELERRREEVAAHGASVGGPRVELVAGASPAEELSRRLTAGETGEGPSPATGETGPRLIYLPHRRHPDPEETAAMVRAFAAAGVGGRLAVLASTEIVEPSHRQPGLAREEAVGPRAPDHPVARGWWELERSAVEAAEAAGVALTLFRVAPLPRPGGGDWVSELLGGGLSGATARTVPGLDPPIQLLAFPDLVTALARWVEAGEGPAEGVQTCNLVPAQPVPLAWALRLAGVRRRPWPLRGSVGGPGGAASREGWTYLAYPWTASGRRAAAELGFEARFTSAQAAAAMAAGEDWRPDPEWWGRTGSPAHDGAATRSAEPPWLPADVDLSFDEHGLSTSYIATFQRRLFRFLHDGWWRVEHRGVQRVPRQGAVVLVGVHRGFMPWDGVMALHLLRREVGRLPRFLVHPSLVKFPFLANYMRRLGGVFAAKDNADLVLDRQGLLAIFPEGIRGAFRAYDGGDVYRLGNFGRRDYVRLAVDHGAPIVPFVTLGSAEIYPILGRVDWAWWRRLSEWPYLPLTPTFPWFPLPLPSKWHTRFLEPLEVVGRWSPEQADDPAVVAEIGDAVEERMQAALDSMLERRRSWWRGGVFDEETAPTEVESR